MNLPMDLPEGPLTPREELEVRITALLMGQLPPEEASALEVQISADPELTTLRTRLQHAVELLREARNLPKPAAAAAVPLQLSKERREKLLAAFRGIKALPSPALPPTPGTKVPADISPKPAVLPWKRRERKWVPVALAASIAVLVGATLLFPKLSSARYSSAMDAHYQQYLSKDKELYGNSRAPLKPSTEADELREVTTRELTKTATELAMGQIDEASPKGPTEYSARWASQSGAIRTFGLGDDNVSKLYRSDDMKVDSAVASAAPSKGEYQRSPGHGAMGGTRASGGGGSAGIYLPATPPAEPSAAGMSGGRLSSDGEKAPMATGGEALLASTDRSQDKSAAAVKAQIDGIHQNTLADSQFTDGTLRALGRPGKATNNTQVNNTANQGGRNGDTAGALGESLSTQERDTTPLTQQVGKTTVIADPLSNSITIVGTPEVKQRVQKVLDELDQPPAKKPGGQPSPEGEKAPMFGDEGRGYAAVDEFQFKTGKPKREDESEVVQRELQRRQLRVEEGKLDSKKGKEALEKKDYETAFANYDNASKKLPNASAVAADYDDMVQGLSDAGRKLAQQRLSEGHYGSASQILEEVVRQNPNDKEALKLLGSINAPDYFNKQLSPKTQADVEKAKEDFTAAKGYKDLGNSNTALHKVEEIFNKDPDNIAASKLRGEIYEAKNRAAEAAYDATRSQAVWEVNSQWQRPYRRFDRKVTENRSDAETAGANLNGAIMPDFETSRLRVDGAKETADARGNRPVDAPANAPIATSAVPAGPGAIEGFAIPPVTFSATTPQPAGTIALDAVPVVGLAKAGNGTLSISEPYSVAGKVNLNQPIAPFGYTGSTTVNGGALAMPGGAPAPTGAPASGPTTGPSITAGGFIAGGVTGTSPQIESAGLGFAPAGQVMGNQPLTYGVRSGQLAINSTTAAGAGAAPQLQGIQNGQNGRQWMYQLQDGTVLPAGAADGVATPANPVTGRIAFWTDDETSKLNINTNGEAAYWSTPQTPEESKKFFFTTHSTSPELNLFGQPRVTSEEAKRLFITKGTALADREGGADKGAVQGPVEFEGFIHYGDPLQTTSQPANGDRFLAAKAENDFGMPLIKNLGDLSGAQTAAQLTPAQFDAVMEAVRAKADALGTSEPRLGKVEGGDRIVIPLPTLESSLPGAKPASADKAQKEVAKLDDAIRNKDQIAPPASAPAAEPPPPPKAEEPPPVPQPEVATKANAFSTFSLNVSDVSYKLATTSLEKGKMPAPGSVRSEEFLNAFNYRDPEPAPGAPLAFASERARDPFAHNRDLLRLSVKTAAAGRERGRPLNLVLLLDNSGSMERADRVRILKESLRVLTGQLQPQDKLSIITFSRTARLWADGVPANQATEFADRVGQITPEGGTNLSAAMDLGYETALKHYQVGSINRVVLMTDGAANLGDVKPEALKEKVESHRKQGVAFDCFGVGWEGYNDDLLEQLSRNGDGRYGFINSPEEAGKEFAGQLAGALQVAASNVKVQVEFNPRRVTTYRQIGYAKHQLKKEQFRDNTVDAAEIGAAESGNALYDLEVNPAGEGDIATVRVRFRVPGTDDYQEHEWTVPYGAPACALEQASSSLRLAATSSAFAEWLAHSPFAANVTTDRLLGLLNGIPAIYGADPRPAKLEWMIRQARSLSR